MPAISAGALKRMLHLPANVVIGTPRVERDHAGREIVVVPVRPYARDTGRCAECGGHGRPYDRLSTRRWRHCMCSIGHLDIGCARLFLEYAPRRVAWMHQGHGEKVFDLFFEKLTEAQRASIRVITGGGARWVDECAFRWCPMAERILDGFHIVSWATDALDKVRTAAWREAGRPARPGKARRTRSRAPDGRC